APTVWAGIPVLTSTQADTLVAGPSQGNGIGGNFAGGRDGNASANSALFRYLEANQGTAKYLVAVPSSNTADGIILALSTWVTQHCKTVPTSLWQSSSTSAGSSG